MSTGRRGKSGAAQDGDRGQGQVARNKRGTPMYSREDIREQYCINDKELHALDASRKKPIFGCLTSDKTEPSPAKKKSLLPACLRGSVPSDENVYTKSQSAHTSPAHRGKTPANLLDTIDYEDETYFRRRPKTICYTDPRRLASMDDSIARTGGGHRPKSDVPYDNYQSDEGLADTKRPKQLPLADKEYQSSELYHDHHYQGDGYSMRRTAYTQPNTPDLGRYRQIVPQEVFMDDRPQKHVSFQQKAMSRSATVGVLEDAASLGQDSSHASGKSPNSRSAERLLETAPPPGYMDQRTLDHLLAPVLTKALLHEKLKRSCMRTQATQTDTASGGMRKSMPQLDNISPRHNKAEMISQSAQTNGGLGPHHRKLVKSLSEVSKYEGIQYEIYDLDDLDNSPHPAQTITEGPTCLQGKVSSHDITLDKEGNHVITNCIKKSPPKPEFKEIFIDSSPIKSRRGFLHKTLSEGEILQERRKCLSLASGYMEVDINGYSNSEEDIIAPECRKERSIDLSRSKIFSQDSLLEEDEEFHEHMFTKEIPVMPALPETKDSPVLSDLDFKSCDPSEFSSQEHLQSQLDTLPLEAPSEFSSKEHIQSQLEPLLIEISKEDVSLPHDRTMSEEYPDSPILTPSSPIPPPEFITYHGESGDHLEPLEESISESQVTVLQGTLATSTLALALEDSDTSSFHLTDPSSAATTPSTRHKPLVAVESFEEDLEEDSTRLRVTNKVHLHSTSNLSSIEDEGTSASENAISESSHIGVITDSITSSDVDKAIASSIDNDYSSIHSGDSMQSGDSTNIKSETLEEIEKEYEQEDYDKDIIIEENIMEKIVQELKQGQLSAQHQFKSSEIRDDTRKLHSPESDSSSSHFTEQETSRSPISGNTTMTSKSDLSRTDSHASNSESSEDYVTATENSNGYESRRAQSLEERRISSPPQMDDIIEDEAVTPKVLSPVTSEALTDLQDISSMTETYDGTSVTSDFETCQGDLTSPDGDTTTSASYYIEQSMTDDLVFSDTKLIKPEIPPKPILLSKPDISPKPKLSPSRDSVTSTSPMPELEEPILEKLIENQEMTLEECKTGAIKKRYSATPKVSKDDNKRFSRYFEDDNESESSDAQQSISWSDEDKVKAKQALKLTFPPGVSMYGEIPPTWPPEDSEKKLKIFEGKPKKIVKIDLGSIEDITASTSRSDSPPMHQQSKERTTPEKTADKGKRNSAEVTTPGMVRSPKMHEGFRLEEWIPVRSPGTPEKMVDTSDESFIEQDFPRHPPKSRSPGKRTKEFPVKRSESPGPKKESPCRQDRQSPMKQERQSPMRQKESPGRSKEITPIRENHNRGFRQSPSRHKRIGESPVKEIIGSKINQSPSKNSNTVYDSRKRYSEIPVSSPREIFDATRRHSGDLLSTVSTNVIESQILIKTPVETGYLRSESPGNTSRERPLQIVDSRALSNSQKDMHLKAIEAVRSLSPGSDNVFLSGSNEQLDEGYRSSLCIQCGERPASREGILVGTVPPAVLDKKSIEKDTAKEPPVKIRPTSHRARSEERNTFVKEWSVTAISLESGDAPRHDSDDDEKGIYSQPYSAAPWCYIAPEDEVRVWRQNLPPPKPVHHKLRVGGFEDDDVKDGEDELPEGERSQERRDSLDSTTSEREFRRRYQTITHRMVHRKASIEMYRRLILAAFKSDKAVTVHRASGEFGFRIHGSRPVVVSAIEADTPAETSGLEVGDIIIAINGANVLDSSHSDVVRLAHSGTVGKSPVNNQQSGPTAGTDTLHLEVARTCDVLTPLVTCDPMPVCAGYLYKLGGAHHIPGSSTISRKWHRRWFALKKDHCLYYYKKESDQHPLGAVYLKDYSVHTLEDVGKPYAFTIAKFGGVTLHLAAHAQDSRNRWGHVITQAAAQAQQRDDLLESTARNVQQGPSSILMPDCFGFLHKLGARWHQWKRRYCVLKNACLYLYHDTEATQAIGVVHLHGYRVQSTSIGGKKHAFELLPPEPKFRHFYFHTESDSDRKRWLAALEYSIDRWIKLG